MTAYQDYTRKYPVSSYRCKEVADAAWESQRQHFERMGRSWTRARVVRELEARLKSGRALNVAAVARQNQGLLYGALKFFGSWPAALSAIGVDHAKVRKHRVWSKEALKREIRALGRFIPSHVLQRKDAGLLAAARLYFGTWKRAVLAAGMPYTPGWGPRKWPRERVLETIVERVQGGKPVHHLRMAKELPGLTTAALKFFKTWPATLKAAGVPYECGWGQPRCWTPDAILCAIREFAGTDKVIRWPAFLRKHKGIDRSVRREFGSPQAAVRVAGCTWHKKQSWPRRELLDALRLIRKNCGAVTRSGIRRHDREGYERIEYSVKRHFGQMRHALKAAGLPPNPSYLPRKWTQDSILDLVRTRIRRGQSVRPTAVFKAVGSAYNAAKRQFGSWQNAVAVASRAE